MAELPPRPAVADGAAPATPRPTPPAPAPDAAATPVPVGAGEVPLTADGPVDDALRLLVGIDEKDLRTQTQTFEDVHGALQARLADAEG